MKVKKVRLDVLMIERGLVESRSLAQKLILAGKVRVADEVVTEVGKKVEEDVPIHIVEGPRFVSRGGDKLEPALLAFGLGSLGGKVCADVGASTGGFTDCLLQHGAGKVYAIDVGYGILHWKLRNDPRVVVMERSNARHLERLPEPVGLVTVDASFISLKILLPVVKNWFPPEGGAAIVLVKPQFEAGREEASRGEGVIHDPAVHRQVLRDVLSFALQTGYGLRGLVKSSLKGPKGNAEFLAHLVFPSAGGLDAEKAVNSVLNR